MGCGTWPLGGPSTLAGRVTGRGAASRADGVRLIAYACDRGMNFFDTADIYGDGQAETILGEALGGRDGIVICSKFGNREDRSGALVKDFSPAWTTTAVAASLRRLRRRRIDVLLLHGPPDQFDWRTFDRTALDRLVAAGDIGSWGVSAHTAIGAERALSADVGQVLEVIYNPLDRRIEQRLLPLAAERGVTVIARVPLAFGFISERFLRAPPPIFTDDDHRAHIPGAERQWLIDAVARIGFLADEPGGLVASALRFCLSDARIGICIPGLRQPQQVDQALAALALGPLSETLLARIAEAVPEVYPGWQPR